MSEIQEILDSLEKSTGEVDPRVVSLPSEIESDILLYTLTDRIIKEDTGIGSEYVPIVRLLAINGDTGDVELLDLIVPDGVDLSQIRTDDESWFENEDNQRESTVAAIPFNGTQLESANDALLATTKSFPLAPEYAPIVIGLRKVITLLQNWFVSNCFTIPTPRSRLRQPYRFYDYAPKLFRIWQPDWATFSEIGTAIDLSEDFQEATPGINIVKTIRRNLNWPKTAADLFEKLETRLRDEGYI